MSSFERSRWAGTLRRNEVDWNGLWGPAAVLWAEFNREAGWAVLIHLNDCFREIQLGFMRIFDRLLRWLWFKHALTRRYQAANVKHCRRNRKKSSVYFWQIFQIRVSSVAAPGSHNTRISSEVVSAPLMNYAVLFCKYFLSLAWCRLLSTGQWSRNYVSVQSGFTCDSPKLLLIVRTWKCDKQIFLVSSQRAANAQTPPP